MPCCQLLQIYSKLCNTSPFLQPLWQGKGIRLPGWHPCLDVIPKRGSHQPSEVGESRALPVACSHMDVESISSDSKTKQDIKANTSSGVLLLNCMISGETTHEFWEPTIVGKVAPEGWTEFKAASDYQHIFNNPHRASAKAQTSSCYHPLKDPSHHRSYNIGQRGN